MFTFHIEIAGRDAVREVRCAWNVVYSVVRSLERTGLRVTRVVYPDSHYREGAREIYNKGIWH